MKMEKLIKSYYPLTASPFEKSEYYTELAPCSALKGYVRCFWGTAVPKAAVCRPRLVIPDTCMDIIVNMDHTCGTAESCFCTIDSSPYYSGTQCGGYVKSVFGIRFYPWAVHLFTDTPLSECGKGVSCIEEFFPKLEKRLLPMLEAVPELENRAAYAEKLLLDILDMNRTQYDLLNCIYDIIASDSSIKISELARSNALSPKQIERIFRSGLGISPAGFRTLSRYQLLWQSICSPHGISILDAVEKFGYTDQSHLLNDFKKHHNMSPKQAMELSSSDNVGFLQYISP